MFSRCPCIMTVQKGGLFAPCVVGRWLQPGSARTTFATTLRVFAVCHGFVLIIRGFVKVPVCNAGVIQQ